MTTWKSWVEAVARGVAEVPDYDLLHAAVLLRSADLVLTAGNGGSAAIASHAAQALMKPDYVAGGGKATVCLTDMVPTFTAHANDGGWSDALASSATPFFDPTRRVALLVISSSGKSENVVRLTRLARDSGCLIVALTGFAGEPLRSLADVSLHVSSSDYEVVEPVHDALIHRVQHHLRAIAT